MSDNVSCVTENLPSNIAAQIAAKKRGDRKIVHHGGLLCSRCLEKPPAAPDRYCRDCRLAYSAAHKRKQTREIRRLKAENARLRAQLTEGHSKGQADGKSETQTRP